MARGISDDQHYKDIGAAIRTKNETDTLYKPSEMAPAILAIQGGVELNFEVVGGTTQPENPKENTIWVNTPNEITSWIFSATEPEAPEEGMVWIFTGTESVVRFNALKENGLQVYPLNAMQYTASAWKNIPVMSFHDGEWMKWITFLYNNGDECVRNGGEWEAVSAYYNGNGSWQGQTLSLNKAYDGLEMSTSPIYPFPQGLVRKSMKIDINHTTLYAEFERISLSGNLDYTASVSISVMENLNTGLISKGLANAEAFGGTAATTISNKIVSIPVSSFVGEYAIGIWLACPSDEDVRISAKLKKMWLD